MREENLPFQFLLYLCYEWGRWLGSQKNTQAPRQHCHVWGVYGLCLTDTLASDS